jgi:uroporphyrinogen-III synthase
MPTLGSTARESRASMKDKTVAILESRMRDHIASLVRKYGGTPFSAPALAEILDVDPAHIDELIRDWNSAPPDIFIFQTGVGTRALFAATDLLGLTNLLLRLLDSAQVVIRGPKPAAVLHSRKVRIDRAASDPFTTREVLAEMHKIPLRGKRVVVQRYGETNRELQAALESEGAEVIEIVTYRWGLPEDTTTTSLKTLAAFTAQQNWFATLGHAWAGHRGMSAPK